MLQIIYNKNKNYKIKYKQAKMKQTKYNKTKNHDDHISFKVMLQ